MHKIGWSFAALAAVLATLASVTAARAQANETWVSDGGSGGNDCLSVAAPCRNFGGASGALAKTVAGGLIHVLPGTYLGFTIDKSIDIIADQGQAAITTSLQAEGSFFAGISVETAATDIVRLRGFAIAPTPAIAPPAGGAGGIMLQSAGILHIENCTFVRGDSGFGIVFAPTGNGELYVTGSELSDSGPSTGGGVLIKPTGSGSVKAVIEDTLVENNVGGILIDGRLTTGTNAVTIRDSAVSGGASFGIFAADSGGGATNVAVEGSTSANNTTFGVGASGTNATVRVRNSTVTGNGTGLQIASGGKLISVGGNVVRGNTANGAFTATEAQQ
jgi:hypothetical protein